jgi:hypothetical protein
MQPTKKWLEFYAEKQTLWRRSGFGKNSFESGLFNYAPTLITPSFHLGARASRPLF